MFFFFLLTICACFENYPFAHLLTVLFFLLVFAFLNSVCPDYQSPAR